ncbi:hypothetical protein SLEP1_g27986 [Rubroshorea leprosula]|uniref:Uncharacterized protein n=1 Tax=Rubroshorea leprosula TaxID=152421 RepID=A0AAV5K0V4_9ROSI|nr:hypothetical protein SLEP1_g27986 [Rubroshorea leprosula]
MESDELLTPIRIFGGFNEQLLTICSQVRGVTSHITFTISQGEGSTNLLTDCKPYNCFGDSFLFQKTS